VWNCCGFAGTAHADSAQGEFAGGLKSIAELNKYVSSCTEMWTKEVLKAGHAQDLMALPTSVRAQLDGKTDSLLRSLVVLEEVRTAKETLFESDLWVKKADFKNAHIKFNQAAHCDHAALHELGVLDAETLLTDFGKRMDATYVELIKLVKAQKDVCLPHFEKYSVIIEAVEQWDLSGLEWMLKPKPGEGEALVESDMSEMQSGEIPSVHTVQPLLFLHAVCSQMPACQVSHILLLILTTL
jgi:hypothetical protein